VISQKECDAEDAKAGGGVWKATRRMVETAVRERLVAEGIDLTRFRANLRDQLLVERTREREVYQRIRLTDTDVEDYLERQRRAAAKDQVADEKRRIGPECAVDALQPSRQADDA
jgi:peptidyl-prolyl cis-trans isomerase SurA